MINLKDISETTQKILLGSALSILAIIIILVTILPKTTKTTVSGLTFDQALLNAGTTELVFSFDQNMIRFSNYEDSSELWLELMDLSFTPPMSGTIRTISEDRFTYIFDSPISADSSTTLSFNDTPKALNGTIANLSINYTPVTNSPYTIPAKKPYATYASRFEKNLTNNLELYMSMPTSLKELKKALTITKDNNNKTISFDLKYTVQTNYSSYKLDTIETNYQSLTIIPHRLKKHSTYTLKVDHRTLQSPQEDFEYKFSTYGAPAWEGLSSDIYYRPVPIAIFTDESLEIEDETLEELSFTVGDELWLHSNNPLKINPKLLSTLTSSPTVSNLAYEVTEDGIKITGDFLGATEYQLNFTPKKIKDIYNQNFKTPYSATFTMKHRTPALSQVKGLLILHKDNPVISFQTVNVSNVQISYQTVSSAYYTALSLYNRNVPLPTHKTNFTITSPADKVTWHAFNVGDLLTNDTMLLLVNIQDKDNPNLQTNFTRVVSTKTGLTTHVSMGDILFHARDIESQTPIENMMISIWDPVRGSFQDLGRTTTEGTLRIPRPKLPLESLTKPVFIGLLERQRNDQIAFVSGEESYFNSIDGGSKYSSARLLYNNIENGQKVKGLLFTDRTIYEPGETIRIHTIARSKTNNQYTSKSEFFDQSVVVTISDPFNKEITRMTKKWSDMGSIDTSYESKSNTFPGTYTIRVQDTSKDFQLYSSFTIQSITAKKAEILINSSSNRYVFGNTLDLSIKPQFFHEKAIKTSVQYIISANPIDYKSTLYPYHQFGVGPIAIPYKGNFFKVMAPTSPYPESTVLKSGRLKAGKTSISTPLLPSTVDNKRITIFVKSTLKDMLPISSSNSDITVYHPTQLGIYTKRSLITNQEPITFNVLAIDALSQELKTNIPVTFEITKITYPKLGIFSFITNYIPKLQQYDKKIIHKTYILGQQNIVFTPVEEGDYTAHISSYQQGVKISSTTSFSVKGKKSMRDEDILAIESDQASYNSGDNALLYIPNPYPKSRLFLTIERDSIREFYTINSTNKIIIHKIALTAEDEPGINVTAVLSAISNTQDISPIKYGNITLKISPNNKELAVNIQKSKSNYRPGEEVTIHISASSKGQQINGQAVLIIRDKAILNDLDPQLPNPLSEFYDTRYGGFTTWDTSKLLYDMSTISNLPADSPQLLRKLNVYNAVAIAQESEGPRIRSNILNTIFYKGDIELFDNKKSTISFTLPDNISGFDITVIAYDKNQLFGKTNTHITSFLDLIAEPLFPKFVRLKDEIEWGAFFRNFTDGAISSEIQFQNPFTNNISNITIAANDSLFVPQKTIIQEEYPKDIPWLIKILSISNQDAYAQYIPLIKDNPYISSSFSGLLNQATNITLSNQDKSKLSISLSPSPTVQIKDQLQEIITNESLYIKNITDRILTLLKYQDTILQYKLLDYTREELQNIIQKDLHLLKEYNLSNESIMTLPNSTYTTRSPMIILGAYHSLLLGQQNNYIIDPNLLNSLSNQAYRYSRKRFTAGATDQDLAQAYSFKILAIHKLLNPDSFKSTYSTLADSTPVQALLLDTMHLLGYPLDVIATQTSKVIGRTRETANDITIPNSSAIVAQTLIKYYGTMLEGTKILNGLDSANKENISAYLAYAQKYPTLKMNNTTIRINNKDYRLSSAEPNLLLEDLEGDIRIKLPESPPIFYSIVHSYIPDTIQESLNTGYTVNKSYFDLENNVVLADQLKFGEKYIVELEVRASGTGRQEIEIILPLYGGVIIPPSNEQSPHIGRNNYYHQDDRIYIFATLPNKNPYKIRYLIQTGLRGNWTAPPISIRQIKAPEVFGYQHQENIIIQ